jgi:hypothetical protein
VAAGRSESSDHLPDVMDTAELDPHLLLWLDRLAETYDDYELFPDMRRLGEVVPAIVADAVGKTHLSHRPASSLRNRGAPIAA